LYSKLLNYFSKKDRTEKEVKQYLEKSNVDLSDIALFISKLKAEKILNENRYTENFIYSKTKNLFWGSEKIEFALEELGVPTEIIRKEFQKYTKDFFLENLISYIEKKKIQKNNSIEILTLKKNLFTKGYKEDLIKEAFLRLEISYIYESSTD
jgi:regulatory protein